MSNSIKNVVPMETNSSNIQISFESLKTASLGKLVVQEHRINVLLSKKISNKSRLLLGVTKTLIEDEINLRLSHRSRLALMKQA